MGYFLIFVFVSSFLLVDSVYSSQPSNSVVIRCCPQLTPTTAASSPSSFYLSLPFTVCMRTPDARKELIDICTQFNATLHAPASSLTDSATTGDPSPAPLPSHSSATTISSEESKEKEDDSTAQAAAGIKSLSVSSDVSTSSAPTSTAAIDNFSASSSSSITPSSSSSSSSSSPSYSYSCKKCRRVLFLSQDIAAHTTSLSHKADSASSTTHGNRFHHKHVKGGVSVGSSSSDPCTSFFIENHARLGEYPDDAGSLLCPCCHTRYGNYAWSGEQCSCGEWFIPAFQAIKSRVDQRRVGGLRLDLAGREIVQPHRPPDQGQGDRRGSRQQ